MLQYIWCTYPSIFQPQFLPGPSAKMEYKHNLKIHVTSFLRKVYIPIYTIKISQINIDMYNKFSKALFKIFSNFSPHVLGNR